MAVTLSGGVVVRTTEAATDTSTTVTLGASPADSDVIVLFVGRSTGNSTGNHTNASRSGFTLLTSYEPNATYDMYVDFLYKESDGTEGTSHTITMGSDAGEVNLIKGGWIFSGADPLTLTHNLTHTSASSVTFPSDSLDFTVHWLGSVKNEAMGTSDFASGDTQALWSTSDWRQGGFAVSGGNTASGSWTSSSVTYGTISISEAAATQRYVLPGVRIVAGS